MSKKSTPHFEFNTSENPFAYIRTENELNSFIQALNRETTLSKRALQLIWITSSYLLNYCRPYERKIKNVIKLIKSTINNETKKSTDVKSPLEIIIKDCNEPSLKEKWDYFKCSVFGTNSNCCKNIIEECVKELSALPAKKIVQNMNPSLNFPYQATLHNGRKKYDIWFQPADTFKTSVYVNKRHVNIAIDIPKAFYNNSQKDYINLFFSYSDYSLKTLLENKTKEILSTIEPEVHQDTTLINFDTALEQWDTLSTPDDFFDDIDDSTGQGLQRILYNKHVTAIHEAGHAVAAHLLDIEYEGVSIEPTKTSAGRIQYTSLPSAKDDAITGYAGGIAEKIYFSKKYIDLSGMRSDLKSATKKIKKQVIEECKNDNTAQNYSYIDVDELGLTNNESPYVIQETIKRCVEAYQKTFELISSNIHLVEALANELLKKETMPSEEVNEFLNSFKESENNKQPY